MHVRNALLPDTEHSATFRTDIRFLLPAARGPFFNFPSNFLGDAHIGGSAKTFFHHRLPVRITTAKIPNWAPQTATLGWPAHCPPPSEHTTRWPHVTSARCGLCPRSTFLHNTRSRKSPPQLVLHFTACFKVFFSSVFRNAAPIAAVPPPRVL